MGLSLLRRLAASAPAPVTVLAGAGAGSSTAALRQHGGGVLQVVASPRHASVLVAAGAFPGILGSAAARVHDQMPHPRVAVWVPVAGTGLPPPIPGLVEVDDGEALVRSIVALHRGLVTGARPSTGDALPDVEPNEWRGVGPYGQGGKGMTGGVPYGRPMTGRAPDRDGLELDQLAVRLGPWLAALPRGLVLDVRVQGDVVQEASVGDNPFPGPPPADVFRAALVEAVPVAEMERARAAQHLTWAGGVLRLLGLAALAARVDRAAADLDGAAAALAARLARTTRLRPPMAGVGTIAAHHAEVLGGPVARAAGIGADARLDDATYADLGFEPVVATGGDAWARWAVRLGEAARSIQLARAAGSRRTTPRGLVESPRGRIDVAGTAPSSSLLGLLPELLPGLEWGDAVVAIASLDLDVEEAAEAAPVPA